MFQFKPSSASTGVNSPTRANRACSSTTLACGCHARTSPTHLRVPLPRFSKGLGGGRRKCVGLVRAWHPPARVVDEQARFARVCEFTPLEAEEGLGWNIEKALPRS